VIDMDWIELDTAITHVTRGVDNWSYGGNGSNGLAQNADDWIARTREKLTPKQWAKVERVALNWARVRRAAGTATGKDDLLVYYDGFPPEGDVPPPLPNEDERPWATSTLGARGAEDPQLTERGNAQRLASRYDDDLIHVHASTGCGGSMGAGGRMRTASCSAVSRKGLDSCSTLRRRG